MNALSAISTDSSLMTRHCHSHGHGHRSCFPVFAHIFLFLFDVDGIPWPFDGLFRGGKFFRHVCRASEVGGRRSDLACSALS